MRNTNRGLGMLEVLVIAAALLVMAVFVFYFGIRPAQNRSAGVGDVVLIQKDIDIPRYEFVTFVDGRVGVTPFEEPCKLFKYYQVRIQYVGENTMTGLLTPLSGAYHRPGGCPVNAAVEVKKSDLDVTLTRF